MYTALSHAGPPIYYTRKIVESTHSIYPGQFTVDFVISKEEGEQRAVEPTLPERTTFQSEEEAGKLGSNDSTPMLVCLHGLSGGSHEVYLREVLAPIVDKGWAACVVNGRGCAMSKITTPRLFNARSTWDLRQTVLYLREIYPNRPLYAVGYSMGANILTSTLAFTPPPRFYLTFYAYEPYGLFTDITVQTTWPKKASTASFVPQSHAPTRGTSMCAMWGLSAAILATKCTTESWEAI